MDLGVYPWIYSSLSVGRREKDFVADLQKTWERDDLCLSTYILSGPCHGGDGFAMCSPSAKPGRINTAPEKDI